MLLGIDEAGRGPVVGPLVLCGVCVNKKQQRALTRLGVRDSKTFGAGERARKLRRSLADKIRDVATAVCLRVAVAEEVDRWVAQKQLNQLERELAGKIIAAIPRARQIIVDGARIFAPLRRTIPQLIAEDHADLNHPVVAAASIVAKAERDALLAQLLQPYQQEFGPIRGSGYCNAATAAFLRAHSSRYGTLPSGVRQSWSWKVLAELQWSA